MYLDKVNGEESMGLEGAVTQNTCSSGETGSRFLMLLSQFSEHSPYELSATPVGKPQVVEIEAWG